MTLLIGHNVSTYAQTHEGPMLVHNEGRLSKVLIVDLGLHYCVDAGVHLSGHTEYFLEKHAKGELTVCLAVNLMYKPTINGRGGIVYCEQASGSLLSFISKGESGRMFNSLDSLTQEFVKIANDYVKEKNSAFVGDDVSVKVNLFDVSRSGCQTEEQCRLLMSKISRFAQDQFHVRKSNGRNTLTLASEYTLGVIDSEIISYATGICGLTGAVADPLSAVAGGNMFVCDSLVFIGKDMLRMYRTTQELRHQINSIDTSYDEISNAISKVVFAGGSGSVVWVGSADPHEVKGEDTTDLYGNFRFQPFYHIDLLFHPLGTNVGSNEKGFTYLFSDSVVVIPDDSSSPIAEQDINEAKRLTKWLQEVGISLDADLKNLDYDPNRISVPLYVQFDSNLRLVTINSPTNGISERLEDGFTYYFPAFTSNLIANSLKADSSVIGKHVRVEMVNSQYGNNWALHCVVKPIEFMEETH